MGPTVTLQQLNLVSKDVAAAVAFYRRLGLTVRASPPEWQAHHVTLEGAGAVELEIDSPAFARRWDQGLHGSSAAGAVVIGFGVQDRAEVDRLCAELARAGHRVQQPPYDAFWGARYAIVEDPDGNPVGLMSPIDRSQRQDVRPPP